jgi:hypothetical protein
MATTQAEKDLMNSLYKEHGLSPEHVFSHKHFKIITRAGIDIIIANSNLSYTLEMVGHLPDGTVVMKAWDDKVTTFASASPLTCTGGYFAEIAQKRAKSRFILERLGLYSQGVFGEDEAETFSKSVNEQRSSPQSSGVPGARVAEVR